MKAHFSANVLVSRYLSSLSLSDREILFSAAGEVLQQSRESGGVVCVGGIRSYIRLPTSIVVFQQLGVRASQGEKVLDSFTLSNMTSLFHACHMRSQIEISEKLTVFFTLTLRHMLDTGYVPDLRPRDFWKDFMFFGLWGTRSEYLRINLYQSDDDENVGSQAEVTRSKIRFSGMDHVESRSLEEIKGESQLIRHVASQVTPLLRPSVCRTLGTFVMALEESESGHHEQRLDVYAVSHYGLDIFREISRSLVKGSLVNSGRFFEYILDRSVDAVQSGVDEVERRLKRGRKGSD